MRVQKHSFLFLEICGIKEEASNLSEEPMWWKGMLCEFEGQKTLVVIFYNGEGDQNLFGYGFFFSVRGMACFLNEGVIAWQQLRDDLFSLAETYLPASSDVGYQFTQRIESVAQTNSVPPRPFVYHKV